MPQVAIMPRALTMGCVHELPAYDAMIEETTRRTYVGYIERLIKPALGSISIAKLTARNLETLYSELRRCRARCDGRPFIERHRMDGEGSCVGVPASASRWRPRGRTIGPRGRWLDNSAGLRGLVASSDRKAAELLRSRLPSRSKQP
jgi:hypothetical protein